MKIKFNLYFQMQPYHFLVFCMFLSGSLACNPNQYLNTTANSCESCPSLCVTCSNNITCTTCPSGFYLNIGVCLSCPLPCAKCCSNNNCSACSSSYFLDSLNFSCVACSQGCYQCSQQTNCSRCTSKYFLNNSVCVQCSPNCTCNGTIQTCPVIANSFSIPAIIAVVLGSIVAFFIIVLIFKNVRKNQMRKGQQQQQVSYITQGQNLAKQNLKVLGVIKNRLMRQWKTQNSGQSIDTKETCSICLLSDVDTKTSCNHPFHFDCLAYWLEKKLSCPICKRQNPKLKKYCRKCSLNYIQCKLFKLRSYMVQFYVTCILCKDQFKRFDTSSTAEMNTFK